VIAVARIHTFVRRNPRNPTKSKKPAGIETTMNANTEQAAKPPPFPQHSPILPDQNLSA
jgi:hypothetical protein